MLNEIKKLFVGRTEAFLFQKLEKEGFLKLNFIYGSYSNYDVARSFIQKLETHEIVTVHPETGTVILKTEAEQ